MIENQGLRPLEINKFCPMGKAKWHGSMAKKSTASRPDTRLFAAAAGNRTFSEFTRLFY
jgi:hypothetical protein